VAKLNVDVKGTDALIKKLSEFGDDVIFEVDAETKDAANKIVAQAKNNLSGVTDQGGLVNAFFVEKPLDTDDKIVYAAGNRQNYAPYVEFGTGRLVSVPNELKELAIQFKGRGIKEVNLPARPFLWPALVKESAEYIKRLKTILKRLANGV
jgi:HK97 gp10 family phage protein